MSLDNEHSSRPIKLMLVDDEVSILNALKRIFRSNSYCVITASDAQQAMSILEKQSIDVIISDMGMPETSGATLLSIVAQRWPSTACILLTGYTDLSTNMEFIEAPNIFCYLNKPWNQRELKDAVAAAFLSRNKRCLGA